LYIYYKIKFYFGSFFTFGDLEVGLKISSPVTPAQRNVRINFGFSTSCCFRVRDPYDTHGQTDERTDGRARHLTRPIGRPHNNVEFWLLPGFWEQTFELCENRRRRRWRARWTRTSSSSTSQWDARRSATRARSSVVI